MNGYSAGASSSAANGNGAGASGSETITIPPGPTNQPRMFVRGLTKDEAVFHLSGVEMAYANSLRRVIMADVPTVCASGLSPRLLAGERWLTRSCSNRSGAVPAEHDAFTGRDARA